MFVGSGNDDESIGFAYSMKVLEHRDDFDTLVASFIRLLCHSANRSRCYRGFILDGAARPATTREIAMILRKTTRQTPTILKVLAEAKLLEQVDCPVFDPSINEPPPEAPTEGRSKQKKGRKVSFPERSGNFRKPFNKTTNPKGIKSTSDNDKKKEEKKAAAPQGAEGRGRIAPHQAERPQGPGGLEAPRGLEAERPQGPGDRQAPRGLEAETQAELNAEIQAETIAETGEGQGATGQMPPVQAPAATPPKRVPIEPPKSDGSGTGNGVFRHRYRTSVLAKNIEKIYDPTGLSFAHAIYAALRCTPVEGTIEAAREIGNFAAAWCYAGQARLPPGALQELWDKSVRHAGQIGRKRARCRNPEAVWRAIFNKRLNSYREQRNTGT
jgi:hypothetical protein